MRAFGLAVVAVSIAAATAPAAEGRFERSLKMLAPAERLEQLCDYTAMSRIPRTRQEIIVPIARWRMQWLNRLPAGDTLEVSGGAFRSRKKWYALTLSLHGHARPPARS